MIKTAIQSNARLSLFLGNQDMEETIYKISFDGNEAGLDTRTAFKSELTIAKTIIETIKEMPPNAISYSPCNGIVIEILHGVEDIGTPFIQDMLRAKEQTGRQIILLHEHGVPALTRSDGCITWNESVSRESIFVLGDHSGFSPSLDMRVKRIADKVSCISIERGISSKDSKSYLGSHVIELICTTG